MENNCQPYLFVTVHIILLKYEDFCVIILNNKIREIYKTFYEKNNVEVYMEYIVLSIAIVAVIAAVTVLIIKSKRKSEKGFLFCICIINFKAQN